MLKTEQKISGAYQSLTTKQKEVLDLLLEHMTSKQIARRLDISHHTVDQRINLAKRKFETHTRSVLATAYRDAKRVYERTVYEPADVEKSALPLNNDEQDDPSAYTLAKHPEPNRSGYEENVEADYRVVPEVFEGRFGRTLRVVAMLVVALTLVFLGLAGLAMYSEISELLS
ncbi:MAG: helix-turn-helix transcriptional regulator [Alteraurantiacibacter sp.]